MYLEMTVTFSRGQWPWCPMLILSYAESGILQRNLMILTHSGQDKMHAILQTAFSWIRIFVFWFKFHWNLFARFQLAIIPILIQIRARCRPGDKPLPEPMMAQFTVTYMRHSAWMSWTLVILIFFWGKNKNNKLPFTTTGLILGVHPANERQRYSALRILALISASFSGWFSERSLGLSSRSADLSSWRPLVAWSRTSRAFTSMSGTSVLRRLTPPHHRSPIAVRKVDRLPRIMYKMVRNSYHYSDVTWES